MRAHTSRARAVVAAHVLITESADTKTVEVTKALAALKPLYGKDNVEVITQNGVRVRGTVRSMKMTQALTKPSVKMERADGEIIKVSFAEIIEIIDHNPQTNAA